MKLESSFPLVLPMYHDIYILLHPVNSYSYISWFTDINVFTWIYMHSPTHKKTGLWWLEHLLRMLTALLFCKDWMKLQFTKVLHEGVLLIRIQTWKGLRPWALWKLAKFSPYGSKLAKPSSLVNYECLQTIDQCVFKQANCSFLISEHTDRDLYPQRPPTGIR